MDGWREGGAGLKPGGSWSDFSRITYNEFLFTMNILRKLQKELQQELQKELPKQLPKQHTYKHTYNQVQQMRTSTQQSIFRTNPQSFFFESFFFESFFFEF